MAFLGTATTGTVGSMWEFFVKQALEIVEKNLVLTQFADKYPLPEGYGKTIKFIKYKKLTDISSALGEGVPPTAIAISSANITAAVVQYGNVVQLSDLMGMTAADAVESAIKNAVASNAAQSIDALAHVELKRACSAAAARVYANGGAISDVSAVLTSSHLMQAATRLRAGDVAPQAGSDFVGVIHPYNSYDLMAATGVGSWVDVNKYTDGNVKSIFNGEVGKLYGVRLVESTNVASDTSGASTANKVFYGFVLGKQAMAMTSLKGGSKDAFRIIVKGLGSAGTADPLDQIMSVGWKACLAFKYLGGDEASSMGDSQRAIMLISTTAAD